MIHKAISKLGTRTPSPSISWLMQKSLEKPGLISLAAGFTDNFSLPLEHVQSALASIFSSQNARPSLQYGSTVGDAELIQLTAEHLTKADDVPVAAANFARRTIITNGSQQLLYLTVEALFDEGDIIITEDPTYFVFLGILQGHAVRTRTVPLTQKGIDVEKLEQLLTELRRTGELPKLKAVYLVTYFQNPTGISTDSNTKSRVIELLRQFEPDAGHPLYIIEDAAYRELRFPGTPDVPSFLSNPENAERVIYAGTYTKPFATGARVGYGVLPSDLFTVVYNLKGNHDFGSSNLLQQLVRHAIKAGLYQEHLKGLRATYQDKAKLMVTAIKEYFPSSVAWEEPTGGLYIWAGLPDRISAGKESRMFTESLDEGVLYVPGELCYAADPTRSVPLNEMRISFGGAEKEKIQPGIQLLSRAMNKLDLLSS
jgi:2-aminoadipate transaminase